MAAEQIRNFFENGNIRNSVNFPATEMDRSNGARILVTNKHIPAITNQIHSILDQGGIKVDNMLNKTKNDISYSIIDTKDHSVSAEVLNKIKAIEGVFMARVLPGK